MNWYELEPPVNNWLVDGLIPSDGFSMLCGKPKVGKSTFVRSLIAAVVKDKRFIGRSIDIPKGTGRVLYVHLDRKDQAGRVAEELRQLGITKEESQRLTLKTAQELPDTYEERLMWLQQEVIDISSQGELHLIVIDLMWQFVSTKNNNDYNAVIEGINKLQKSLADVHYKGALVVTLHARKDESSEDPFDNAVGSTGQRGSFGTNIMLKRHRKEETYTIESEQTQRGPQGEIPETILTYVGGEPVLGMTVAQHMQEEREDESQKQAGKVLSFIQTHPHCTQEAIMQHLHVSKKKLLPILERSSALLTVTGKGARKSPFKYSVEMQETTPEVKYV